ncbi:MAG: NAD(P)/FAD-dependent oxidoreductase [Eubacteriales bacterium]|nr:NAD(P)/FAD-dependent oxidoreductase [Christensenellaceae bacterium]MEA5067100.1 NAD(P)/FAD-dependent oxidoreductase [Eubacteriales bacterium]
MRALDLDVAIIGAGVIGCSIARRLSRYDLRIGLIEAREDVAMGASRANSAIVHAGYDCRPGSTEARLNVRGNQLFESVCEELDVPFRRTGSLVVGMGEQDEAHIRALYERGLQNGVEGLFVLNGDHARELEPSLNPDVTCALLARTAAITCPYKLTMACAENAGANGCVMILNSPVSAMAEDGDRVLIEAGDARICARYVVNAAGVYSDEVARMLGDESFSIQPRKGEYVIFDRSARAVDMVIFQTPSAMGKGVLVSPTVDGNMFAGPTAFDLSDRDDCAVSQQGLDTMIELAGRSVPDIDLRAIITSFAGVRAQPSTDDFIIGLSAASRHLVHAAGICSPGLTASPAIAEEIEQVLRGAGLPLNPKPCYQARMTAIPCFREMTADERRQLIEADPRYGRVICRCETVTEGEIVEAIRRGARSLDGVKRRTRAGMGRCQGGFCAPRVMDILSRELGVPMEQLTKFGGGSYLLAGSLKEDAQ